MLSHFSLYCLLLYHFKVYWGRFLHLCFEHLLNSLRCHHRNWNFLAEKKPAPLGWKGVEWCDQEAVVTCKSSFPAYQIILSSLLWLGCSEENYLLMKLLWKREDQWLLALGIPNIIFWRDFHSRKNMKVTHDSFLEFITYSDILVTSVYHF